MLWFLIPVSAAGVLQPGDDWCAAVQSANAGDEIRLAPGEFQGPCTINHGGSPGAPVVLTSDDPANPAHIVYSGASDNVINVLADDLLVSHLRFGPTQPDIDAIKIKSGSRIRVEQCQFSEIGGISVSANSADGDQNAIVGNSFENLQATGLYLGCHDGSCVQSDLEIRDNRFDGVTSANVGYAMEVKLNSWGIIERNVIRDTKGPGIEVYGSSRGDVTIVRQNLVWGGASGAIEIGGGPAEVYGNLVIGAAGGGIVSYDYGGRGLVSGVHLYQNTAIGDGGPAFSLSGWKDGADLRFENNAGYQRDQGAAIPSGNVGMTANVECDAGCFVDEAALDLWPTTSLMDQGATLSTDTPDFCGRPRQEPQDIGAFDAAAGESPGPLGFGFWSAIPCDAPTGDSEDTSSLLPKDSTANKPCGCQSASPWPWLAGLPVGLLRRRRFPVRAQAS